MKNLKILLKTFPLILLLAFASCKKDKNVNPGPDTNTPISAAELTDYSLPIYLSSDLGLRIIYFNKDGNDIKATFDAVSARRIFTVNIIDNVWTLDLNGNGSVIYTFTFARREDGRAAIYDATYKKQDDASVKIQSLLVKNSDVTSFANKSFIGVGNTKLFLKFSSDHNFAVSSKSNYEGAGWSSYYDLCPGAWKGNYNGVDYMGLTIITNPNEKPQMYVQAGGANAYVFDPQ